MSKPTFFPHPYHLDLADKQIAVTDSGMVLNDQPVLLAKAQPFTLSLGGPQIRFTEISPISFTMVLLDPETHGDTFCPMDAAELAEYEDEDADCENGTWRDRSFRPRCGMGCNLTYDELSALIQGLERVKVRMENAKAEREKVAAAEKSGIFG